MTYFRLRKSVCLLFQSRSWFKSYCLFRRCLFVLAKRK